MNKLLLIILLAQFTYSYDKTVKKYWTSDSTKYIVSECSNEKPNGFYYEYDKSERLITKGYYSNGIKHREWFTYDTAGNILSTIMYRYGKAIKPLLKKSYNQQDVRKKTNTINETNSQKAINDLGTFHCTIGTLGIVGSIVGFSLTMNNGFKSRGKNKSYVGLSFGVYVPTLIFSVWETVIGAELLHFTLPKNDIENQKPF